MKTKATACVYVTDRAMSTVAALDGKDEGARDLLAWRPETDIRGHEGYYLNASEMRLAVLPEGASVALVLSPADAARYARHVAYPVELRGVVFSGAPRLPKDYAVTLNSYSPLAMSLADQAGAEHVQNLSQDHSVHPEEVLLSSNAVVLCIKNVLELIDGLQPDQYVEIQVPVMAEMLGMDRGLFDSDAAYSVSPELPFERKFLRVGDIQKSIHPDAIFIAMLHTENFDSNFFV